MLKVAAYCRVSTDKEDQVNSLENQTKYFKDYINRNSNWQLTKVYVDEGITGTSTKNRYSFQQMIEDAENQMFHLILTKEISRFARNTLDSIFYTRKLKDLGIGVIFMNDNINTLDADSELRLTIMSSIAQEESRKISERVKWGQRRRMEQGVVFGRDLLGYDVRRGNLYINKNGAEIVRLIFHKFVNEGKGTYMIAKELEEAKVPTSTYMNHWSNVEILRILKNEKYCGDLIQKKTYTYNYLNHKKRYNQGEEDFIIIRNHHEAIISKDMFDLAQKELDRRSKSIDEKAKYSNKYCFSGKIKCGICQASFVAHKKKRKDGTEYRIWRCYEATKHGKRHKNSRQEDIGCDCQSIREEDLKVILLKVIKDLNMDKQILSNNLLSIIKSILNKEDPINQINKLQNKIKHVKKKNHDLLELYLDEDITKQEFQNMSYKLKEEISLLEEQLVKLQKPSKPLQVNTIDYTSEIENIQRKYDQMQKLIWGIIDGKIWEDQFCRTIIDKIIIYENHQLEIKLNCQKETISYHWSDK